MDEHNDIINYDENNDENNDIINYLNNVKNNLIKQNEYIHFLLNNINDTKTYTIFLSGIIDITIHEDNNTINVLKKQLLNNSNNISQIDKTFNSICEHNIIEDYVEAGIEHEMIKIKYCDICNITL